MNRKSSRLILSACSTVLALGLLFGGDAFSAETSTAMEQKIATAKTKADHESLAMSYEQEATELQVKADDHKAFGKAYSRIGGKQGPQLVSHCNSLARKYGEAAQETTALAKLHRGLAAKAQP